MFIPTKQNYTQMSPSEFEGFVMSLFKTAIKVYLMQKYTIMT